VGYLALLPLAMASLDLDLMLRGWHGSRRLGANSREHWFERQELRVGLLMGKSRNVFERVFRAREMNGSRFVSTRHQIAERSNLVCRCEVARYRKRLTDTDRGR
jgi:hypothetical protein